MGISYRILDRKIRMDDGFVDKIKFSQHRKEDGFLL